MPEKMENAIREMPRDAEVIELLKNFPTRARFLRANHKDRVWSMDARRKKRKEIRRVKEVEQKLFVRRKISQLLMPDP